MGSGLARDRRPGLDALLLALNGLLLALVAGAVLGLVVLDRGSPEVERVVRRYAAAVTDQRLEAAVAEIAPGRRAEWQAWIAGQLGNIYVVTGLGVRSPSLLTLGPRTAWPVPTEATVVLDVNRGYPGFFYQPTTRVGVVQADGRWYLAEPLLAPEALSLPR